jgi:hypothetical protein
MVTEKLDFEKRITSLKNKRFVYAFLSFFPFSMFFLIGILSSISPIKVLVNINEYRKEKMIIDSLTSGATGSEGGVASVGGIGSIKGKRVFVDLGSPEDHLQLALEVVDNGLSTVDVYYNERISNIAILIDGRTKDQIRKEFQNKSFKHIALIFPFLFTISLFIYYHLKFKKIKNESFTN